MIKQPNSPAVDCMKLDRGYIRHQRKQEAVLHRKSHCHIYILDGFGNGIKHRSEQSLIRKHHSTSYTGLYQASIISHPFKYVWKEFCLTDG